MMLSKKKYKLNNSGAALITVIIVISFISVLATIILYAAGKNHYMKATDVNIKESFYSGEKALEEIKAGLMVEAQKAFEVAYKDTMENYLAKSSPALRKTDFNSAFVTEFTNNFNTNVTNAGSVDLYMQSLVEGTYTSSITYNPVVPALIESSAAEGYVKVGTVEFSYEQDGYLTVISTDYVVKAPEIWFGGASADPGATNDKVELVDCVQYQNWTKK